MKKVPRSYSMGNKGKEGESNNHDLTRGQYIRIYIHSVLPFQGIYQEMVSSDSSYLIYLVSWFSFSLTSSFGIIYYTISSNQNFHASMATISSSIR